MNQTVVTSKNPLATLLSAKSAEDRSKRNWTLYGAGTIALCWGGSGASAIAAPAALAVGGIAFAGVQSLRAAADGDEDTWIRRAARSVYTTLFGEEGEPKSQLARRLLDFGASIGISMLFGGATATALIIGLAGGAAVTIVTTWTEPAPKSWRQTYKEQEKVARTW